MPFLTSKCGLVLCVLWTMFCSVHRLCNSTQGFTLVVELWLVVKLLPKHSFNTVNPFLTFHNPYLQNVSKKSGTWFGNCEDISQPECLTVAVTPCGWISNPDLISPTNKNLLLNTTAHIGAMSKPGVNYVFTSFFTPQQQKQIIVLEIKDTLKICLQLKPRIHTGHWT